MKDIVATPGEILADEAHGDSQNSDDQENDNYHGSNHNIHGQRR